MSRFDNQGMFWEDVARISGDRNKIRPQPPIPDTGWTTPAYFPNLSSAKVIAIDCETYDPELLERGPGWARGKGHIVGVSIGVSGGRWYFPIRHEIEPEYNLPVEPVLAWLRDTLSNPHVPKVGANIMYDVGWLAQEGVHVAGDLVDVQYAEALLDEGARVGLETLAQKYLGEGKESNLLYRWCADFYGGQPTDRQRANIYRSPPRLVGPYAESDADLPLRVAAKLYPLLEREGMVDLFKMECDLIRLLIAMRMAGVRVNVEKADELRGMLAAREVQAQDYLDNLTGFHVDIGSATSLSRAFDDAGLSYPRTIKGAPSFTKGFLEAVKNPIADAVNEIRRLSKLRGTFIESYILNSHIDGMLYGQFHPLRGDEGGTRSGRFSSSTPNLQNIPARDAELAMLIRGLFLPDVGHKQWRKYDYSQIEYRFLAHYAVGPMSDEVRYIFNTNPNTDYHELTQELVRKETSIEIGRKGIKNINFGLIYGMGVTKLSNDLGLSVADGKALFAAYHEGAPFANATSDAATEEAKRLGTITTILGRKSRFDLFEPAGYKKDKAIALPYERAILQYGNIERAMTHKALNRRLQGSAADLMKKAMQICWNDGIFNETGVPRLTVHDELDFSDPGGKDDAFNEMQRVLESAIPLRVPIRADYEAGPDWGHVA